jgi:hypothetical protein
MIEAEGVPYQHARIEFRIVDATGAKYGGPGAAALRNRKMRRRAGDNALWRCD